MREKLFTPGHLLCPGCGQGIAAKIVTESAGKNTIVVMPTGCLEVSTSYYPYTSWNIPFIHSLFENAAAVATGVESALQFLGKENINVIAQAGDGGMADIGFQAFSGAWERGTNILSICYDNEAFMNTGIQRSGLTPCFSATTTSPPGKVWKGNWRQKKDLIGIALAHGCVYVATATVNLPFDLHAKVRAALRLKGPKLIHILCPCPLGWGSEPELTYQLAELAVKTGFFPIVTYENGKLVNVHKIKEKKPILEYLKLQRRFAHLLKDGKEEIKLLQEYADENIKKFQLI